MADAVIKALQDYSPCGEDSFLFDANVWITLCFPIGEEPAYREYSSFMQKVIVRKAQILLPLITTSEIINRIVRREYKIVLRQTNKSEKEFDFKRDFRPSEKCRDLLNNIYATFKSEIFSISQRINDYYEEFDISALFNDSIAKDFNDACISALACKYDCALVTNDSDFKSANGDITILTANKKMLK